MMIRTTRLARTTKTAFLALVPTAVVGAVLGDFDGDGEKEPAHEEHDQGENQIHGPYVFMIRGEQPAPQPVWGAMLLVLVIQCDGGHGGLPRGRKSSSARQRTHLDWAAWRGVLVRMGNGLH